MTYIEHDNTDPCFNFGAEEYFMGEKDIGDDNLFMFWRTKPTLMIGRFQNTVEEINTSYAEQNGLHIVRRNSGGGTIYTDEKTWQFSFIVKNYDKNACGFRHFTEPVVEAMQKAGLRAEFGGRNDLFIEGKKISGNAQFRRQNAMVHHGSILFATDLEALVKSISVSDDKIVSKGIKSVRERVTRIADHLKTPMNETAFRDFMVQSILQTGASVYRPSFSDIRRIEEIADKKFRTWEWNYGTSPAFNIERKKRFASGGIAVNLSVKKGIIENCKIYGDFFASGDIEAVEKALCGIPYEKQTLAELIEKQQLHTAFYSLSAEELLESIIE
ncbi:lipoate--protein ligase [Treponema sp. HNW]|uniref:lipoate--protein ligase n=1 Tax=Treponema sp. HNW TaxID=3116654 RepID=UPI003D1227CD